MKPLSLNEIRHIINQNPGPDDCLIKNIKDNIKRINHDTVVFHLNKTESLNETKFKNLRNCYIVTDQPLLKTNQYQKKCIFVPNVYQAYKTMTAYYRNLFKIPIIAVTGTCGKTTTKEMISQVLKNKHNIVHTISSKNAHFYNNDYLFSIDEETEFGVFETGVIQPGNLINGCELYKPTIGIITMIGIDHLNYCKTIDNYIRTKAEMLTGLNNQGTLIINNDDINIKKIDMSNYHGQIITFGIKEKSHFFGEKLEYQATGMKFLLNYQGKYYPVFVPGLGEHNVYNALAALASLTSLEIDLEESITYLSCFDHIRCHMEFKQGRNNCLIIDDTWSSNPTSIKAALGVLSEKGKDKRKVLALGKISYLGEEEDKYYEEIAKEVIKNKIDILFIQDVEIKAIGTYAYKYGMKEEQIINCYNNNEALNILENLMDETSIILFKTSMLDKTKAEIIQKILK